MDARRALGHDRVACATTGVFVLSVLADGTAERGAPFRLFLLRLTFPPTALLFLVLFVDQLTDLAG